VSREFGIGTWIPDKVVYADDGTALFLWTVHRKDKPAPEDTLRRD
jgi:hypothetical protein